MLFVVIAASLFLVQPSRELAEQTIVQLQKFKKHLSNPPVRELLIIGGVAAREQVDSLERGVSFAELLCCACTHRIMQSLKDFPFLIPRITY